MTPVFVDSKPAVGGTRTATRPAPSRAHSRTTARTDSEPSSNDGVRAVLVERADGTCVVYGRGRTGEWPSISDAWTAIERMWEELVWRMTTPGVWVARADANERPALDDRPWPTRRTHAVPPTKGPAGTESYMTARVIRGITSTGSSDPRQAVRSIPA
jgi:hypothetical protein